ncbi:MAG: insulinase family protein [Candidatus Omnitrophica bacterium]|nr:insulinase family protein [Candidatus Omnitrophota bacterium]MCM8790818.1 insulinase family protein [Candidatus Omnitrophota bacterium]
MKVLENGLKVMAEPMAHMESVSIGIWLRVGGRYENKYISGISHLLEHLLFKGTLKRDMMTIKQEIEGRGGSFNGFTSEEHTCYLVKVLAKDAELGVDILSDMVLNAKLDNSEIDKEKNVIIEEINMYKDIPAHYVHEILAEMMWPGQPLGQPLAGTVESVKAISRDDIVAYKNCYYNPSNMLLIGAGRITAEELEEHVVKYLLKAPKGLPSRYEKVALRHDRPCLRINVKQTEQTHIAIGLHALDRFSPDRYAMSLLNIILGANMSSRLFHIVRDEMGLCYEISSSVRRYEDCGAFVISAGVEEKKLVSALEVILKELTRVSREAVSAEEMRRAKEYYKGQLLFALEDTMSHMLWLGEKLIAGEKDISVKDILDRVEKVTQDDLMRIAQEIFRDANLNLAAIGPIKDDSKIKNALHF